MTRSVAMIIAGKTGEETHVVTITEMPSHTHVVNDPGHYHTISAGNIHNGADHMVEYQGWSNNQVGMQVNGAYTGITIQANGNNGGHENVQPTVFIPYIVRLDG